LFMLVQKACDDFWDTGDLDVLATLNNCHKL